MLLLLVAGGVWIIGQAHAYNFLGGKWQGGIGNMGICVFQNTNDWHTPGAWLQSLSDWDSAASEFGYTEDCDTSDIILDDVDDDTVNWDGIMNFSPDSGGGSTGYYSYAVGYLNTHYTSGYSAVERESVSGHELGHGLGLAHVDDDPDCTVPAIMYPSTGVRFSDCNIYVPQQDDIDGVAALY